MSSNFNQIEKEAELGLINIDIEKIKRLKEISTEIEDVTFFVRITGTNFITSVFSNYGEDFKVRNFIIEKSKNPLDLDEGLLINDLAYKLETNHKEILFLNWVKDKYGTEAINIEDFKNKFISVEFINKEKIIELFFDVSKYQEEYKEKNDLGRRFYKILEVIEKNNKRYCLLINSNDFNLLIRDCNSPIYNYLDKGRYFKEDNRYSYNNNNYNFFDLNIDISLIKEFNRDCEGIHLIYEEDIKKALRGEKVKEKLEEKKSEEERKLSEEVEKKIKKEGFIEVNGINFNYRNGLISYNGLKVGCKKDKKTEFDYLKDVVSFNDLRKDDLDFNNIFDRYCREMSYKINRDEIVFFCGKFSVNLNLKGNYYINHIRINKGEIHEVLTKAICFDKVSEYEKLLKEVSKCSIRIHNILNNGINVKLSNSLGTEIYFKIPIVRVKNKNKIKLNDKLIEIKRTNSLTPLDSGKNTIDKIIEVLTKNSEIKEDEVMSLIKVGLVEYKEAIRKSEELLKETITILGITKANINGTDGYIIKGKLREYFIDEDCKIYTYPEHRYLCVVDRTNKIGVGKDKIISRMYALKNDEYLINDISTLK